MIKIDIISGFLGAGKTTLIKKLVSESLQGVKLAIIENEFGEIGIDSGFLKSSGVEIKELDSGCICCSLVGDFETSLKEVVETYHPERIIIEPSGVGKLSDVAKAVGAVQSEINGVLNNKIVVVDVTKCKIYSKNFGEFFIDQVVSADTIILSRMDKASDKKIKESIALLTELNSTATIITTPITDLSGEVLLESIDNKPDLLNQLIKEVSHHEHHHEHGESCGCGHEHHEHHHEHGESCGCGHEHHEHHHEHGESCGCGHEHHGHHHADEVFQSLGILTTKTFSKEDIQAILNNLGEEHLYGFILRAKGMVQSSDGKWIHFDYVPEEMDIRDGEAQVTGKICVIGSKINQDALKTLIEG